MRWETVGQKHVWEGGVEGHGQELWLYPQVMAPWQDLEAHVSLTLASATERGAEGPASKPEAAWTGQGKWDGEKRPDLRES